jgi:thiol-disulfide isomerase/thioredoxin
MKRLVLITTGIVVTMSLLIFISGHYLIGNPASGPLDPSDQVRLQAESASESRTFTVADVAKTGRPQFLNAYATWCPYCQQNEPIVYALRQQFKDRVDFINLNVDGEGVLEAAAPFTITGVTQYVLISSEGEIIEKWFGTIDEKSLSESMTTYLESI